MLRFAQHDMSTDQAEIEKYKRHLLGVGRRIEDISELAHHISELPPRSNSLVTTLS